MPFTLVAYQEVKPLDTTPIAIAGVPDQHIRVEDEFIYMSLFNQIIGVFCGGATELTQAHLASPSLRRLANYAISQIGIVEFPAVPYGLALHPDSPLALEVNEGLEAIITASATITPEECTVGVFLSDGPVAPISGEIFPVRATATGITLAAEGWANTTIDFDDTLPVGRYQVVGARASITDGVLFRLVPIGEAFRPGGIITAGVGEVDFELHRNGGLGVWCEFDQITPPSVDLLGGTAPAGTDLELFLDLIKVG